MTQKRAEHKITRYEDYKLFILAVLDLDSSTKKGLKSAFAEAIGCQLSYLSRVLNGDAHLSPEQAEAATQYLFLNPNERAYFMALVSEARAGTEGLKKFWAQERKRIISEQLQLHNRIPTPEPLSEVQMARYYSDWINASIHIMTGIPAMQNVEALAKSLKIAPKKVREALQFLISIGLVERKNTQFRRTRAQLHLSIHSPLWKQHNANWKLRAIDSFSNLKTHDLHYASVVSLSRNDYLKIKDLFLECIEKTRLSVHDSEDQIAAVYMMDLFELTT